MESHRVVRSHQQTSRLLNGLILIVDQALLEAALHLSGPDFEDDVQIVSAQSSGLHLIVTRNVADFVHGPIPALTPSEVVARLSP